MPKKENSEKTAEPKKEEEVEKINPRWELINELYDAVDESIVSLGNKNEMNFVEISMALHMINKKVEYEQFRAMWDFNMEGHEQTEKKPADNMYR